MIHMITKLVDMHHEVIFYMYKYSLQSIYAGYAVPFLCHHCSGIFYVYFSGCNNYQLHALHFV